MTDDLQAIPALLARLAIYRRTLDLLEEQRARLGPFTPTYIRHQLDEARREIGQIKQELRSLGQEIEERAGDVEPALVEGGGEGKLLLAYERMLVEQVRCLPLAGLSDRSGGFQLAGLYVERTLAPGASTGAGSGPTLAELAHAPRARILLEGAPGSGKSVCLHRLVLACAARAVGEPRPAADLLRDWLDPLPMPILLNASDLVAVLRQANALPADQSPTLPAFWAAIEAWLRSSDLGALVPTIQRLLQAGGCLVCIDGFDDLEDAATCSAVGAALGRFVARYPDNRYVVTCRRADPALSLPLASFACYTLRPLDGPQLDALVAGWYAAIAPGAGLAFGELAGRVAALQGIVRGDARLRRMASSPLALAICVLVHAQGWAWPAARGEVARRMLDLLLDGESIRSGAHWPTAAPDADLDALAAPDRQLTLLRALALVLHAKPERDGGAPAALCRPEAEALLRAALDGGGTRPEVIERAIPRLLARWCRRGLLSPAGPAIAYAMPQEHLREYLAAGALAQLPDFAFRASALRHDRRWCEPLLLAMQVAAARRARVLLRRLLESADSPDRDGRSDLLLAAECLREISARATPEHAIRAEVLERLLATLGARECPIDEQVQAGLALGYLGDPRFAELLPQLAIVADGSCLIGSDAGYDDEGPEQIVDVPTFAIGVYAVTNREYVWFLAENPNYPRPRYWHDLRYNNPSQPVVGVTWHDADAYCAWLTTRLDESGRLPAGMVVRLPSEAEWEKAASWDAQRRAKRQYPWGDTWSSGRANTAEGRGDWTTTPPGCYPQGASAYGVQDMIGNVWEWTASEYAGYPGTATMFHEPGSYTLRGASCVSLPSHARCTYRSRLPALSWRYHLGFRVVLGRPL